MLLIHAKEPAKTYSIFREIADEVKGDAARAIWDAYDEVRRGVEFAKALGYVPDGVSPQCQKAYHPACNSTSALDEEPDDLLSSGPHRCCSQTINQRKSYEGVNRL